MQRIRIFVDAQNALNIFKYRGFSPEVGSVPRDPLAGTKDTHTQWGNAISGSPIDIGLDANVYPLSATYRIGLNVTF